MIKIRHSFISIVYICQEFKRGANVTARGQFNNIIIGQLSNHKDIMKVVEELSGFDKKKF